jgi:hypothetical protein
MRRNPLLLFLGAALAAASAADIDTGKDAMGAAKLVISGELGAKGEGWLRLRGIAAPDDRGVAETRDALMKLRAGGSKTCIMLRWPAGWEKVYLPADLREAFENGRKLGAAYGDLVDGWEIDNEPDLGFVPESAERYTAYLKATYLGLKAGSKERLLDGGYSLSGSRTNNPQPSTNNGTIGEPIVLMGALGLPPGPWLERFAANDGFAYTDGFNYHYYGYAEDFTAVYRAHENAVKELSDESYQLSGVRSNNQEPITNNLREKSLPVFLTEIGYGMLGRKACDTKEGRLRQWRWFKSVGEQVAQLRPEAPMAFYLPPYLEYDTLEFGLTVPAKQGAEKPEARNLKPEGWVAGGIEYTALDFAEPEFGHKKAQKGTKENSSVNSAVTVLNKESVEKAPKAEAWMKLIGKEIGGNEITPALAQWLALRAARLSARGYSLPGVGANNQQLTTDNSGEPRPWIVRVPAASPVVIDFIAGDGLLPIKRYNGSFVTGTVTSMEHGAKSQGPKPTNNQEPLTNNGIPRSEEFMIHVRTANGNLYEVYPTRLATPEWQSYMEPQDNFTMSFYGRAELPWRFRDSRPVSLVVVMYPKVLPTVYEFRRMQLLRLGSINHEETRRDTKTNNQEPMTNNPAATAVRNGHGRIILYNFSDKPVTGRLQLPEGLTTEDTESSNSANSGLKMTLQPNERREIEARIAVPAGKYERFAAPVTFEPEDTSIPPARFRTDFIPDIGGMQAEVVARLLHQRTDDREQRTGNGKNSSVNSATSGLNKSSNREIVATRPRATEEAPMVELEAEGSKLVAFFAQQGAQVGRTSDGFTVTVTGTPPGKERRVEVEIPWPEAVEFKTEDFLSLEYRLQETLTERK